MFKLLNKKYVLKLLPRDMDISKRFAKIEMHKYAVSKHIAPRILYIDNEQNPFLIVIEYVEGEVLKLSDINDNAILKNLINNLKIIHSAPTSLKLCSEKK